MLKYNIVQRYVDENVVMDIGHELLTTPEALFCPSLIGLEHKGLHELIYDTIMKCPMDTRKDLFANILLSGML